MPGAAARKHEHIMDDKLAKLSYLSYECRLLQCGLTTLETMRLRGDQIEV